MLKADFHIHSHYSPDSGLSPEKMIARCEKVGLNCIAVTDHNTIEGSLAVKRLAPFQVIIGEEVRSSEGEITGLFLSETVPRGLTAEETARRIKDQGGLVSLPHPFDHFRGGVITRKAMMDVLPYTDIVEVFNARNMLHGDNRKAREFAEEHHLIPSGVSDGHSKIELGRTYVEMPEFDGTPEGFKRSLAEGTIVARRTNRLIHIVTATTKIRKRLFGGLRPPP